jgi:hypothetical protein
MLPWKQEMLRKLLSLPMVMALAAAVLLGPCSECQPPQRTQHSCCDPVPEEGASCPRPQPADHKQCPDRHEILRNYAKSEAPSVLVELAPVEVVSLSVDPAAQPLCNLAKKVAPRSEGPPDLFLRNAAILI